MESTFIVTTDTEEKVWLESAIKYARWIPSGAHAGFEASFEVRTLFVAEGSTIIVKGMSSSGGEIDRIVGKVFSNRFKGKLLIPENTLVASTVWFEVTLPKHGLTGESNEIPVRPAVQVRQLNWDRDVVTRNETVKLLCQFESGVQDGQDATVIIYGHNPDSWDFKVVSLPATIKKNRIELEWEFSYHGDTGQIPTEAEKRNVDKHYIAPQYYFVVVVDGIVIGKKQKSGLLQFSDTVDITVQHGNTSPQKTMKYTVTFADGRSVITTTDKERRIVIKGVPPGPFTILPEKRVESDTLTGKTGTPLLALFPDTCLLIDAHMHIQSNNCCPLPLQWAIVAENVGFLLGRPSDDDRKKMNDTAAGLLGWLAARRLGKIGRLSSDMIGRLYYEKLHDNDMRIEMCWTVLSDDEMKMYGANQDGMRKIAGRKAKLSDLTAKSSEQYDRKFIEKTRYYFEGNRICRMGIALLMDMSFASYWGRFGLPLYLSTGSGMFYVNDFASVIISQQHESGMVSVRLDENVVTPKIAISPHYGKARPSADSRSRIHLFPSFCSGETKTFGASSLFYAEQFDRFKQGNSTPTVLPLIRFEGTERVRSMLARKYVHFVEHAPGEDPARFEDYAVQRERSIAAAIMNPMTLFTFYHYDPRRHCLSDKVRAETVAENILAEQAFFTVKQNDRQYTVHGNVRCSGCIDAVEHATFNDPAQLSALLGKQLRSNDQALAELHLYDPAGQGVFWGVKMYPRLGFSPSDFRNYPQLEGFYAACEAKGIPITVHCGPGGMSIADYFLYERYDEGWHLDVKDMDGCYNLKKAAGRFDGVVNGTAGKDSPARWAEVLQRFPGLKLNLAHFGSSDTWKECAGFEKMDEELAKRGADGKKYHNYDKYRDWTKKIADLVHTHTNVYTDISFFVNDDPSWFFGVGHDRDDVAKDLVYLLKKYPSLKDRLLMGSDWYMIEKEGELGIGDYFRKMFHMLRTVSGETGFDAWHQFSVVNPLRFLGVIEEKKGGGGPFTINTENLEKLKGKFEGRMKSKDWKDENGCLISKNDFKKLFDAMIALLKTMTIHNGDKMVRDNRLMILQPEKE